MPAMLIRHRVGDFDKWLEAFEAHAEQRKAFGEEQAIVWQDATDSNNVFILFKMADLARAREFIESDDLKQAMQGAGVIEPPSVHYLENGRKYGG